MDASPGCRTTTPTQPDPLQAQQVPYVDVKVEGRDKRDPAAVSSRLERSGEGVQRPFRYLTAIDCAKIAI